MGRYTSGRTGAAYRKILITALCLIGLIGIAYDSAEVTRVVDGDTFVCVIEGEEYKVRLLGVDTPESVESGTPVEEGALEASGYTKQLEGKRVVLTYDKKKTGYYGRLLAYVWVEVEHGEMICWNVELIREGYSELYTKYKFEGKEWFEVMLR